MTPIILVENLSKSYMISHKLAGNYKTLRESASGLVKGVFRKMLGHNGSGATQEELWALKDINFEINEGERIGLIGRNGAGKSTLLKILSRITSPTEGRAVLRGRVGSLLEVGTGFHQELTGRENIYLNGAVLGMKKKEIKASFDRIVDFAGVEKFLDTPVKRYSSGMYVRLAFAVSAHMDTDILLVDEVLAVGDISFRRKCMERIREINTETGRTIVYVSHDIPTVRQICQRVIILSEGRILKDGEANETTLLYEQNALYGSDVSPAEVIRKPQISPFYLSKVQIRDLDGNICNRFETGQTMQLHIWAEGEAPYENFTVGFDLHSEYGDRITFGTANPINDCFFEKTDRYFVCTLGPLPLTTGKYFFTLHTKIWQMHPWDVWQQAVSFYITDCDPYKTGFNIYSSNVTMFINQRWRSMPHE
ncbi:ABC transporter ATP-binding protein [Candidatus Magnetomonas plexicatena]|uniref:ABC transporter ATP-binding protein n=1 Tax=Candidatus Magnetomonas plexicatena TaxID=2552947 RepID=UPI001104A037|nr:ABC transporter ATP-binding protein [Nitrospirales bacterium LBB_01]